MDKNQLKRLMKLSRQTGTPLIISDSDGQEPIVLMGIEEYEHLLSIENYDELNELEDVPQEFLTSEEPPLESFPTEKPEFKEETRFENDLDLNKLAQESVPSDETPGEERFYLEPIE